MTRWTRIRWKIGEVGDYELTVTAAWYMPITLIWWFKALRLRWRIWRGTDHELPPARIVK